EGSLIKLTFTSTGSGKSYIGYASLMPTETKGLRKDLADKISAMKPTFIRFPGGCFVEGNDLKQAWDWKASIGPVEQRKGQNFSFWGYPIGNGLGYHEYLQWCEDIKAEPLYVANVGMSHREIAPINEMD